VIFRKVTNGFRSEWGAKTYADLCFNCRKPAAATAGALSPPSATPWHKPRPWPQARDRRMRVSNYKKAATPDPVIIAVTPTISVIMTAITFTPNPHGLESSGW